MMKQTLPVLVVGAGLVLAGSAEAEPAKFDGAWSVQLVTHSGLCDAISSTAVTIRNGHVQAGGSGVSVSGQIGPSGAISLAL